MSSVSDAAAGATAAALSLAQGGTAEQVDPEAAITVRDVTMAFGELVVMRDLNFTVRRGDIFIIMGPSGCGKSALLRHMIGLLEPAKGDILYGDESFTHASPHDREQMLRRFGVLYQSGGLWSSMTLAENVALPLAEFTDLRPAQIREIAALKLALVGLAGFEDYYPSQISGGMQKRAGLARAMALDPDLLFFDEPSAGLDPISSRLLDELILELQASLGSTAVVVTHELASIFAIGSNSVYLDVETRTAIAHGNPRELRDSHPDPKVRRFLNRGKEEKAEQPEKTAKVEKNGHVEKK
jgi:phospholipid/cholesterol/gamma-HCH transport system ATP-binding protein